MIGIAETRIYQIGRFTIRQQPLPLNPAWATHLIFLGRQLIGRQFSVPCTSDCEWHLRRRGVYATSAESADLTYRNYSNNRRGRQSSHLANIPVFLAEVD